jgi:CubicO group peptidase (beta-lactamase class C family)
MGLQDRARIERIVADLRPQAPCRSPLRSVRSLAERMTELCAPGISVAVIENFEVAWASSFGILKMGHRAAVQPDTPFQAASISKAVFALAVMRLCQDKRLDLDADIRTYLKSWQLPQSDDGWGAKHQSPPTVEPYRGDDGARLSRLSGWRQFAVACTDFGWCPSGEYIANFR